MIAGAWTSSAWPQTSNPKSQKEIAIYDKGHADGMAEAKKNQDGVRFEFLKEEHERVRERHELAKYHDRIMRITHIVIAVALTAIAIVLVIK